MLTCVTLSKNTAFLQAIMQKQTNALSNKRSSLQQKYVIVFHRNLENKGICLLLQSHSSIVLFQKGT